MAKQTKGGLQRFADGARVKKGKGMAALNVLGRIGSDADAMMNTRRAANTQFGDVGPSASSIIKDTGGNWLPSFEANSPYQRELDIQLKRLKRGQHDSSSEDIRGMIERNKADGTNQPALERSLQEALRKEAANKWVDSNLRNYITKQMATEADPVRKLADEGVTAFPKMEDEYGEPQYRNYGSFTTKQRREETGFPKEGVAKTKAGKHYETLSDEAINPRKAESLQRIQALPYMQRPRGSMEMPWVNKLDPESHIYGLSQEADFEKLGFNHIMDVLREDLAAGRIRPEQLNKMSMEQAVRRAHQYDEELKAKMLLARQKEMGDATLHKEYPEGYKWVELNKPGQFALESDTMGHSVRGYEPPKGHPDWIESSDNSGHLDYGHGGWEAIKAGRAKIYSLRDPKGMSHATVEVGPHSYEKVYKSLPLEERGKINAAVEDWTSNIDYRPSPEEIRAETERVMQQMGYKQDQFISQIKGKQNTAPNEEYQPYIQDFVKGGEWADVRDLHNTGLTSIDEFPERKKFEAAGMKLPRYLSDIDKDALINEYNKLTLPAADPDFMSKEYGFPKPEGMAKGGSVPKYAGAGSVKKGKGMAALGMFDRLGADASTLMNARNNTKFGDMAPPTSGVIKEAGGNWFHGAGFNRLEEGLNRPKRMSNATKNIDITKQALANLKSQAKELDKIDIQSLPANEAERVFRERQEIDESIAEMTHSIPMIERNIATNNWIDKHVKNYVTNEMGTEGDRVRRLFEERWAAAENKYKKAEEKAEAMQAKRDAEPDTRKHPMMDRQIEQFKSKAKQEYDDDKQHIAHMPEMHDQSHAAKDLWNPLRARREALGFPPYGQANAPTAQNWENMTDSEIKTSKAYELGRFAESEPWLNKVDPQTRVHTLEGTGWSSELGIPHIMDRLHEALESGVLKPEKMQSMTFDQAVRMTADMDRAATKQMREAAVQEAKNLKVEKDYPDAGMRWVDLNASPIFGKDTLPEGWSWEEPKGGYHRLRGPDRVHLGDTPESAIEAAHKSDWKLQDAQEKALRKALEYESDIMGHCVGRSSNYCNKVMSGQGRILSLRNESNEPHVTIETSRKKIADIWDLEKAFGKKEAEKIHNEFLNGPTENLQTMLQARGLPTYVEEILQVKGKSNKAPVEKYQTYVQDLIREKDFPVAADFDNTGLRDISSNQYDLLPAHAEKQGLKLPRYLTEQERSDLYNHWDEANFDVQELPESLLKYKAQKPPEEGMKEGGTVKHSHHYHQIARDFDLPHLSDGGEVLDEETGSRSKVLQDLYATIADMKAKNFAHGGSSPAPKPVSPSADTKETIQAYKDAATNAYYNDKRHLITPKGKKEFGLQALASYAGTPADLTKMAIEGVGGSPTMQIATGMANKVMSKIPSLTKPVSVLDPNGERVLAYPLSSKMEPATKALEPYTSEGQVDKLGHDYKFYSAPLAAMAVDMGAGVAMPKQMVAKNGARLFPIGGPRSLPKPAH